MSDFGFVILVIIVCVLLLVGLAWLGTEAEYSKVWVCTQSLDQAHNIWTTTCGYKQGG